MFKYITLVLIMFILFINVLTAFCSSDITLQGGNNASRDISIYGSYHRGMMYPHHGFIRFYNEDYINGLDIRVFRSFPEIRDVRTPRIGVGLYHANLGNNDIYGKTTSLFFSFRSKLLRDNKTFNLGSSFSCGLNYVSNPFHEDKNLVNQAVGSYFNGFIILSADFRFFINQRLSFYLSPSLVHMSNGKIILPNAGLNIYTMQFGANYIIDSKEIEMPGVHEKFKTGNKNRLSLLYAAGLRQKSLHVPEYEFLSTSIVEYSYSITPYLRLGAGGNLFYTSDEYLDFTLDIQDHEHKKLRPGIHLSCEIAWGKISFILQPGIRFQESDEKLFRFNRVGLRYNMFSDFYLNCSLKSFETTAEYLEWGIGYNLDF